MTFSLQNNRRFLLLREVFRFAFTRGLPVLANVDQHFSQGHIVSSRMPTMLLLKVFYIVSTLDVFPTSVSRENSLKKQFFFYGFLFTGIIPYTTRNTPKNIKRHVLKILHLIRQTSGFSKISSSQVLNKASFKRLGVFFFFGV